MKWRDHELSRQQDMGFHKEIQMSIASAAKTHMLTEP